MSVDKSLAEILVSVIVPNFNHAQFLQQRIDSILNQTVRQIEIIILDDCSTDNSKIYIEKYRSDDRVSHIIYNQKNSGSTFLQWDKGISLARGEYIWIAESDDWCEPSFLESVLEGIKRDEDCVISYCQSSVVYQNLIKWQSHHQYLNQIVDGREFVRSFLSVRPAIFNASMAVWKKDKYYEISKEFMNYKYCGDWFFWAQLAQLGKVHITGKVLNYFRKHPRDVTTRSQRDGLEVQEGMKLISFLYDEKLIGISELKKGYKRHYKLFLTKRQYYNTQTIKDIKILFKSAPLKSIVKFRVFLSAVWAKLLGKTVY